MAILTTEVLFTLILFCSLHFYYPLILFIYFFVGAWPTDGYYADVADYETLWTDTMTYLITLDYTTSLKWWEIFIYIV